jgi:hypothetical protein
MGVACDAATRGVLPRVAGAGVRGAYAHAAMLAVQHGGFGNAYGGYAHAAMSMTNCAIWSCVRPRFHHTRTPLAASA